MNIISLELKNFRNIDHIKLEPCEGMNVICGENAQGKTNLIEGIWILTGAKSFRGSKEKNFVKIGLQKAICFTLYKGEGTEKEIRLEIEEKRTAFLNDNKLKSPSLLAGNLNAVVFSPADLKIISEGPKIRRNFLDLAISQLYPSYIDILRNYIRAVTQRNKIIKDFRYDSTLSIMLDVFETEISENGKKIVAFRNRYIEILNEYLPELYSGISEGKEILELKYLKSFETDDIKNALLNSRKEDSFTSVTSVGPHRDDLGFYINGLSVREFGSQGQKRSVALSLKLAQAQVIKKKTGEYPICLLDDVMSELDPGRQNFVLNKIKEMQTFLTCCDPGNIKNLKAGKTFFLKEGKLI